MQKIKLNVEHNTHQKNEIEETTKTDIQNKKISLKSDMIQAVRRTFTLLKLSFSSLMISY